MDNYDIATSTGESRTHQCAESNSLFT